DKLRCPICQARTQGFRFARCLASLAGATAMTTREPKTLGPRLTDWATYLVFVGAKLTWINAKPAFCLKPTKSMGENDECRSLESRPAGFGRSVGPGGARQPLAARRALRRRLCDRGGGRVNERHSCLGWLRDRRDCRSPDLVGICRTPIRPFQLIRLRSGRRPALSG